VIEIGSWLLEVYCPNSRRITDHGALGRLKLISIVGWRYNVRWLILAFFIAGMILSLNWHQAKISDRKAIFGLLAVAAFALVLLLALTMT